MKYYKVFCSPGPDYEYYAVEGGDKPFWWFHTRFHEWRSTSEDGISHGQTWDEWQAIFRDWSEAVVEISKLEVLVVCGAVI